MASTAIFRCDASREIGAGHFVRCETLAHELGRRGWDCRIIALPGTRAAVAGFATGTVEVIETAAADDPAAVHRLIPAGCDLFVLDSYRLGVEFERAVAGTTAACLLVIEDRPAREHAPSILLDPTFGRQCEDYERFVPSGASMLLGSAYALLRPAFAAARGQALARRKVSGPIKSLLVALGGAPTRGLLDLILGGVAMAELDAEVHVVSPLPLGDIGSAPRVIVHPPTPNIDQLMSQCDVAIGAAGGSAWERCCLGLPTLMIQVADNQAEVAASLALAGAAVDLGPAANLSPDAIAAALRALDRNPEQRAEVARKAALACDGLGAQRVAGVLSPRRARDGKAVTLRPVLQADACRIFEWQQIPDIRRHANDPRPPRWEEHVAWFRRRMDNPWSGPFSIIECSGPAGVLRLDRPVPDRFGLPPEQAAEGYLVSILVEPAFQGQGIAGAALAAARDLVLAGSFYAEVREGNVASHKLFRSAGYSVLRPNLYVLGPRRSGTP